ncbi:hypothetical protein AMTRI_Chr01g130600 [Amborella trichopoda]|uniref:Retrotransposon gag domain-containing protein n=1 Tax=Amborella trichopoda TaxID=13333 RepID=W1NVT8_AMBTC|nr:hypothetical protein AMTR_s00093p00062000 [Amborella trichopoda]
MDDLKAFIEYFMARLESLQEDMLQINRALGSHSGGLDSRVVRVPKPQVFEGQRDSKVVENFLWNMQQYFKAAHDHEKDRVVICTMYLARDAKLWWRMRLADASWPKVSTWKDLKRELNSSCRAMLPRWHARLCEGFGKWAQCASTSIDSRN